MAKKDDLFAPPSEDELIQDEMFEAPSDDELFAAPSADEMESIEDPSRLEAIARGAGQGATMGFLDELIAGFKAGGVSPRQEQSQPVSESVEQLKEVSKKYDEEVEKQREQEAKLREEFPWTMGASEIAGGVLPALLTGGGSAAAAVAKEAAKPTLKQAAKLGAQYGAVSGAGYSEGDTPQELLEDIAIGTATGAGAGVALPIKGSQLAKGSKATVKGAKDIAGALIPESEAIKAGYKFGREGKKLTQDVVDEELKDVAGTVLSSIKSAKESKNLKGIKDKLEQLGIKVNTKDAINKAIDDLEKIQADDMLGVQNQELLPKLKQLVGANLQEEKLTERATKSAIKKKIQSQGKQAEAVIKAEKDLAKRAIQSPDELQTLTDREALMEGLEIPFDTSQGKFGGAKGTFKREVVDPQTGEISYEDFTKEILKDTTEFQPVMEQLDVGGRPVIKTTDLGSGKVSALVGNIENRVQKDISNMTVSEVEALRKQLNVVTDLAKSTGTTKDPVIARAKSLAKELRDITDKAIEVQGGDDLSAARKKMSDILAAEDLLGVSKGKQVRSDLSRTEQVRKIAEKLGFKKGFTTREEAKEATELLGDEIVPKTTKDRFRLMQELNSILGRESQENISRAGIYKKVVGDVPNLAGRAVKVGSEVISPVTKAKQAITGLTDEQFTRFANNLAQSENQGLQTIGNRLLEAGTMKGAAKQQMLWSLSQSPAMRELIKREAEKGEQFDLIPEAGASEINTDERTEYVTSPSDVGRSPAASEFLTEKEGGSMTTGYVPAGSPKSGVTIATGLDLGNFDLNDLNVSEELKTKLKPYVGFRGDEARAIAEQLTVTPEEAKEIDDALDEYNSSRMESDLVGIPQDIATDSFKEGLESLTHNTSAGAKALTDRVRAGKIDEAIDKGVEWNKSGGRFQAGLLQRRMEELYKMFPDKADLIQSEGKIEYDKYQDQTKRSWDQINTIEELERDIDRVNKQQSSGDETPVDQIDQLLEKVNRLNLPQMQIDELENDAVQMIGYGQGQELKEKIRRLMKG